MSASSFYDVVVVGNELAGAVAGALLARRGFRVLLLAPAPVEREAIGPYAVPRDPLALTGLEAPALKRVVSELNLLQLLRRRVQANHPAVQLLLPDHRLDGGEELGRELSRELPGEATAVEAWLGAARDLSGRLEGLLAQEVTLPPDGFWDRRDLKRIAAQLPEDEGDPLAPLTAGSQAALLASLAPRFSSDLYCPGPVPHARLADLTQRGTWTVDGGRDALRALLHERIRTYTGEVRHDLRARGLVVRRGKVTAVGVGDRDESVGCTHVIAALTARDLLALLPEAPPKRLEEAAALPAPLRRYRLHLVAPLDALPDALGPYGLSVRDGAAPLEEGNALQLHVTTGFGQHAVITATALTAASDEAGYRALRPRVRAHLDALLPFVTPHLLAVWSPHDGLAAEGQLTDGVQPIAQPADAVWAVPAPRALGLCGLPHASGIKGLWLASRQLLPGLGLEGELQAGWGCARLIAAGSKKREVDKAALLGG